jgi:hypothetical protein
MDRVKRLDKVDLRLGSLARIKQPRMPSVVWVMAELEWRVSFSWESRRVRAASRTKAVREGAKT